MTIAEALRARISIDNAHSLTMRSEILIKQVWALSMLEQVGEEILLPETMVEVQDWRRLRSQSDRVFRWWRQFQLCFHRKHL